MLKNNQPGKIQTDADYLAKITDLVTEKHKVTVYLVRHGETSWNAQQLFQGQKDIALNETGIEQAKRLGERLQHYQFGAIHSSGLVRAQQTAALIAAYHSVEVAQDSRFNEMSFGEWEGLDYASIQSKYPRLLDNWYQQPLDYSAPQGETLMDLTHRVLAGFTDMIQKSPDNPLLLVAHGGPLQTLLCTLLNIPLEHYWQFHLTNASLSSVSIYPEGTVINLLNDTSHLINQPGSTQG